MKGDLPHFVHLFKLLLAELRNRLKYDALHISLFCANVMLS